MYGDQVTSHLEERVLALNLCSLIKRFLSPFRAVKGE